MFRVDVAHPVQVWSARVSGACGNTDKGAVPSVSARTLHPHSESKHEPVQRALASPRILVSSSHHPLIILSHPLVILSHPLVIILSSSRKLPASSQQRNPTAPRHAHRIMSSRVLADKLPRGSPVRATRVWGPGGRGRRCRRADRVPQLSQTRMSATIERAR